MNTTCAPTRYRKNDRVQVLPDPRRKEPTFTATVIDRAQGGLLAPYIVQRDSPVEGPDGAVRRIFFAFAEELEPLVDSLSIGMTPAEHERFEAQR